METEAETEEMPGPEDGKEGETRPLSVVAVTAFRPDEVVNSVTGMDAETTVVTVDADTNPAARAWNAARKTRRAIREVDPDLLLLDSYGTVGAPTTLVASRHGVPVVGRLVSDIWRRMEEEWFEPARQARDLRRYGRYLVSHRLNRYILGQVSGFVGVSTELGDVVARRTDCPPERVGVVPVPVTTDTWRAGSAGRARESLGVTEERVVLTVTNLSFRAKLAGAARTADELAELLRADPDLAYVVAGDGRYHGELVDALDERFTDPAVRRRVYAPGYVDNVADLYALADVFVYVSYLDGYPNAVLEAQTAGLPVVANAAHGMLDQVTDGETGVLVEGDESGALREAVAALLADPEERRRMGERARERVRRENSPAVVSRQLEAFLRTVVADLEAG